MSETLTPLEEKISKLNEKFGEGTVIKMDDKFRPPKIGSVSSGSLILDDALGIGGIPKGRIIEIYGRESVGKTTLALTIMGNFQKLKHKCIFIDAEHSLDIEYAEALGVDIGELIISQPDYGEQAFTVLDALVSTGEIGCVVIDSVSALVPKAELEGEYGKAHMATQARLMSQAMRKLAGILAKTECTAIFVNQTRANLAPFGSPWVTSGGNALKFYSSIRLEIKRTKNIEENGIAVGIQNLVKVSKNKLARPFQEAEFDLVFGEGIDKRKEMIEIGVKKEIIEKSGTWYSYKGERLGQGIKNTKKFLEENQEIKEKIIKEIEENG